RKKDEKELSEEDQGKKVGQRGLITLLGFCQPKSLNLDIHRAPIKMFLTLKHDSGKRDGLDNENHGHDDLRASRREHEYLSGA
ncbi:hypothetical protein HispidOSU_018738, partial [Sigmodon hispidus]